MAALGSLGGAHFATIGRQDLIFKLCICTEDMMNRIAKHQPHHHHHHHHHYHRHHHRSSIIIITAAGRLGAILPGSRQLGMAAAHQGRHSMRASCSQHPFLIPHFLVLIKLRSSPGSILGLCPIDHEDLNILVSVAKCNYCCVECT